MTVIAAVMPGRLARLDRRPACEIGEGEEVFVERHGTFKPFQIKRFLSESHRMSSGGKFRSAGAPSKKIIKSESKFNHID